MRKKGQVGACCNKSWVWNARVAKSASCERLIQSFLFIKVFKEHLKPLKLTSNQVQLTVSACRGKCTFN